MADEEKLEVKPTPASEAPQQKLTPEQIQRMLAARQQQQGGGISLPFGDGSGTFTNVKDEVISLFFLAQQGILTPEEVRQSINVMKKQLELDEISKDEWDSRFKSKPEVKK